MDFMYKQLDYAFAENKFRKAQLIEFVREMAKNMVGQEGNTDDQHFLLFR